MRYKIVLKAITNKKLLKLLSEKIAEKEHIPQIQVIRELAQGGYVYASDIHKAEAATTAQKLSKLHITYDIVKEEDELPHKTGLFVPKDVSAESDAPVPEAHRFSPKPDLPSKPSASHHHIETPQEHHEANLRALYGLDQAPPKKEKTSPLILIRNGAILVVLILLVWFIAGKTTQPPSKPTSGKIEAKKTSTSNNSKERKSDKKQKDKKSKKSKNKEDKTKKSDLKSPQSAEEAEELKNKADDICGKDGDQATKLYRVAISFNKKNINAWNGLLNCYKENNLRKEALETEAEMRKIFGDDIFTLQSIVSQFGELEEFTERGSNANLRYLSDKNSSEMAMNDIFTIGRGISNISVAKKITIYSTLRNGTGILVTISASPYPTRLSDFMSKATIDIIQ